jgi:hypothetical protein
MSATKNPKWNRDQQAIYDECVKAFSDKGSDLYTPNGSQRGKANYRRAFWNAYNGTGLPVPKGTMLEAAAAAGRDCKAKEGGAA